MQDLLFLMSKFLVCKQNMNENLEMTVKTNKWEKQEEQQQEKCLLLRRHLIID